MNLKSVGIFNKHDNMKTTVSKPAVVNKNKDLVITDKVSIGQDRVTPDDCPKVFGTVGAMVGAIAGRATVLPGAGAAVAGAALGSVLGPAGTIIGGVVGFAAGAYTEFKTRAGRVIGGMIGGAAGVGLGKLAKKIGHRPSQKMVDETRSFTYKSLFNKLKDPTHTSHKTISTQEARNIMEKAEPGDLIVTNHDGDFRFELVQKVLGQSGDWTHIGLVSKDKSMLEVLISTDGGTETDATKAITKNHHIMLLRPNHKDRNAINDTEKAARDYMGVKYDHKFSLKSDDKHYCQEFVYKALKKGDPNIKIEPSKLFGFQYVVADDFINSPDTKVVHTTGSNFWTNLMSKFS